MKRKLTWFALFTAAIVITVLNRVGRVQATPSNDFTGTTLAVGRFGEIEVFNHLVLSSSTKRGRHDEKVWLSSQRTKGPSDVYVQNNTWAPGGSTGWHSHPGHSLIIVTEGTVTAYEGNDPDCTPHVYTQGMGFVDEGGDHVHLIRNESDVDAKTVAVQLIPAGATRRIDAPDPGNCHF